MQPLWTFFSDKNPENDYQRLTVPTFVSTDSGMSSSEDDNPISQFHKDLQNAVPKPEGAGRSAADDIIEAIGNLGPKKVRAKNSCPQCSSVDVTVTRPLGGAPRSTCGSCKHRWYGVPRGQAPLIKEKVGPGQTLQAGPYYRGGASLPPKQDPFSPTSRRKGKPLSLLRKKAEGD